jgi:transcriptional regulator with XRE-family HTH domain
MATLGERIKQMRKHRSLTQDALASGVGVSKRAVIFWEKNKDSPQSARLAKLAEALGCNLQWLITGEGEPYQVRYLDLNTTLPMRSEQEELKDELKKARATMERVEKKINDSRPAENSAEEIIRKTVLRMPLYDNPEIPHVGVAAADEQDGREYDVHPEPGETSQADAVEPRTITVRGSSAEDLARDGQQVVIDAGSNNVPVGELCVVLTRDGLLRLKRKTTDAKGLRRYASINREFPAFEVQPRQVVAEFPVVTILIKAKKKSPVETFDEGFPT